MAGTVEHFSAIYQRACERKGGVAAVAALTSKPLVPAKLTQLPDSLFLAELTKKVFQSGFVWRVVRQKWPNFCELFFDFDLEKVLLLSDEMLEKKAADPRIIRNVNKVFTIRANALMIYDVQQNHASFASFIANWPSDNIIGLWAYLKQHGARLGGNTGPYALRAMGKDTFLLTGDIEGYLRAYAVFDGGINSKRSQQQIQQQFTSWQQQSGLSLQEISQIVALSCGENQLGMQR
ncbi:3-methyladenine DNA glycosylase [Arsukibacterium sp. MJ3]|jgi:3-methyladenine DNA glycosylase Tag|uniref:DNA-3-methyladenine glycosylase I n=1 Tax=Arsukibacterium sp. MJ3 TaxID=1632859 RepID=UPI0006272F3D|nr:DNA-3-methyladenine glycosylase I [Arsukibacterium sp. MJ3]KKO50269.1 3-methyladenine DNA glycosylase [Arsukibacterium sp. MJ3]